MTSVPKMNKEGLLSWQNTLMWEMDAPDKDGNRVDVVMDELNNIDRISFIKYVHDKNWGLLVPSCIHTGDDLISYAMNMPANKLYIIAMPKSSTADVPASTIATSLVKGINTLKQGILFTTKRTGEIKTIPKPNIIIIATTGTLPLRCIPDEWKKWMLGGEEEDELKEYAENVPEPRDCYNCY